MKKFLAVLLVASVGFMCAPAYAYLCWGGSDSARAKFNDSEIVFSGTVKSIKEIGESRDELGSMRYNMMFEVGKVWKGLPEVAKIIYVDTESIYEYNFKVGQEYLVYAFNLYDRRISIVGCPRAIKLTDAARDLKDLGESLYEEEEVEASIEDHNNFGSGSVESMDLEIVEPKEVEVDHFESDGVSASEQPVSVQPVSVEPPASVTVAPEDVILVIRAKNTENNDDALGDSLDEILGNFDDITEDGKGAYYPPEGEAWEGGEYVEPDAIAPVEAEIEVSPAKKMNDKELMDDLFGEGINLDADDEPLPDFITE